MKKMFGMMFLGLGIALTLMTTSHAVIGHRSGIVLSSDQARTDGIRMDEVSMVISGEELYVLEESHDADFSEQEGALWADLDFIEFPQGRVEMKNIDGVIIFRDPPY